MAFYVHYVDDGPVGICGQSCNITSPWARLFVCETRQDMGDLFREIDELKHRINPRVVEVWSDSKSESFNPVIVKKDDGGNFKPIW